MQYTKGFTTRSRLLKHYQDHAAEVGVDTVEEYETLADYFLGGPLQASMRECVRPSDKALIRFDTATEEFGILRDDNYIQTYYIPDPRWHEFPSNLAYFKDQCKKR